MPVLGRWHSDDGQCRNQSARQASSTQPHAPKQHRHCSHMICTGYYTIFNDYGGTSSQRRQASKFTGFRLRSESWNLQTTYDRHSTHSQNARLLVRVLRMCTQNIYKTVVAFATPCIYAKRMPMRLSATCGHKMPRGRAA